jgi:hypothetical protein
MEWNFDFTILRNLYTFLHGPDQIPITIMITLTDIVSLQLHVFPELSLHFSSPGYKNLPDFTFFRFSSHNFLSKTMDLLLCYQMQIVQLWKYVSSGWCTLASDSCTHHVTSLWPSTHEQIFLLPWSKELAHTRPALNLMRLSITATQWAYFVFPMSHHCSKMTSVFISETFKRNEPRLHYLILLCPCNFTLQRQNFIID